jgi:pilus assembly protein Flp/PilA
MLTSLTNFILEEEGAAMIEYALMVALIALVCFGGVAALGQSLVPMFSDVSGTLAPK